MVEELHIIKMQRAKLKHGSCQLCSKQSNRLERHHTSYYPERTIDICHNCHYLAHYQPWHLKEHQLRRLMIGRYSNEGMDKWKGNLIELYMKRNHKASRKAYLDFIGAKEHVPRGYVSKSSRPGRRTSSSLANHTSRREKGVTTRKYSRQVTTRHTPYKAQARE